MTGSKPWPACLVVAALLMGMAPANAQVVLSKQEFPAPGAADRALLKDAIDIHAHLDPDSFGAHSAQAARALDVMDMAKQARKLRMRGFVIKQHYDQTAQLAYVTATANPGIQVFGMLCMNLTVGGLNPDAVYHFAEVKGGLARIVSMPTWDSENNVRQSRNPTRKSVAVSRDGALLPEAKAVIAAVAAARVRDSGAALALSTGHVSAAEALLVVAEARKQGIVRIVVTHAMGAPINMTLAQMQEAVRLGAYIEFVGSFVIGEHANFTSRQYADAIRALGPDHVILSSDSGQVNRPFPPDMLALMAGQLRREGLTVAQLRTMMVDNPARLLGLAAGR